MGKIVSLFRRKTADRFEVLVGPHVDGLYRFAYRLLGNRADAEDLVQELLTKLYPRHDELAAVDQVRPWLARALYNLYVDTRRRSSRDPLGDPMGEELLELQVDPSARAEQAIEEEHLQRRLTDALDTLNADQRAIVILHDMEEYTLAELESILETPIGTLKSRLHRARERLREVLQMEPFSAPGRVKA